jgi:L-malate glycosyltransferase
MLTVLMVTHNGARTLPTVLDAYCKLDPPAGDWNMIVVDNASTDTSKHIIASFISRLPLTYIFEPTLGKSAALNAGLRRITGDLVVMTDDDAVPEPDWLARMRTAADSLPSFAIFGGAIVPHWEVPPPSWLFKLPQCTLAITDPSWEEGPSVAARVYGPNLAVRAEIIKSGYQFDTSWGPVGSRYRMGEDTEFVQRLSKAGFRAWHCKSAVVAHMIRKEQMKKPWMLRRAKRFGSAFYQWEYEEYSPSRPVLLLGTPRYMIREVLEQAIRVVGAKLTKDSDAVFKERWQLCYLAGRAAGARMLYGAKSEPAQNPAAPVIAHARGTEVSGLRRAQTHQK